MFRVVRLTTNPDGNRSHAEMFKPVPATGRIGNLRLTRIGKTLAYAVADEAGKEFKELYRAPFGTEDVKVLRLAANPGGTPNAVDIRIIDLRIRHLYGK